VSIERKVASMPKMKSTVVPESPLSPLEETDFYPNLLYPLEEEGPSVFPQWGRFINKKRGEKNKNRGERQKNSENQVTLDSIFGASKKRYLSNFVLYML
jgi:hypothetical protein